MNLTANTSGVNTAALRARLQHRIDQKTKPLGSLGRIELLALQIGLILRSEQPVLTQPQMVVFAGDHGIAAHGVSAYPSEVTWQMVENFLAGGAAVSVLARQHGLALTVVDAGVRHEFTPRKGLLNRKIAPGTADALIGPAMSEVQCTKAVSAGRDVVRELPGNALLLGEMGIGNTSSAALLLAQLTGEPIERCIGRGLVMFQQNQPAAIFVIFITSIWPILINTAEGVRQIPQDYRNVALVLQMSNRRFFTKILIPSALPYIFTGLRISIGLAWLAIIAAEIVMPGTPGIGFFIWDANQNGYVSDIVLGVIWIGAIGLILDRYMAWL
ncbi:MAG: nicotinate-nucleotide--dimethylbenzimidazole phosphoribosyltransferase, partial [Burkholderiales bacterium]